MSKPIKPSAARRTPRPAGTSPVGQLIDAHTASLLIALKLELEAKDEKKRKASEARKKRRANGRQGPTS
jgi:hypothetical protein